MHVLVHPGLHQGGRAAACLTKNECRVPSGRFYHALILKLGGFPLSLHFQSLGIQLMSGEGLRSGPAKILRSAVDRSEYACVTTKSTSGSSGNCLCRKTDEVQRRVAIIDCQGAPDAHHCRSLSLCGTELAGQRTLESRDALATEALIGECERFFRS